MPGQGKSVPGVKWTFFGHYEGDVEREMGWTYAASEDQALVNAFRAMNPTDQHGTPMFNDPVYIDRVAVAAE